MMAEQHIVSAPDLPPLEMWESAAVPSLRDNSSGNGAILTVDHEGPKIVI